MMSLFAWRGALLIGSLVLLSACGHPAPADAPITGTGAPQAPAPSFAPAAPGAIADPAAAAALIAKAQAAYAALPAYHARLHFFQKKGGVTATGLYDLRGKQPRALRIEIIEGGNQGVKLLWNGGKTAQVRPAGLLSALTVSMPIDAGRLLSLRGYTLADTDIPAIYTMMRDPANQATLLGTSAEGAGVQVTGPKLLKGCEKMVTTFDPTTLLPRAVRAYDAREMVFSMELPTFERKSDVSLDL